MNIKTWSNNLLKYINSKQDISQEYIKNIIEKDNVLLQCSVDFFSIDNMQNIIILYGKHSFFMKDNFKSNVLCVDYLEGKTFNEIVWEKFDKPYKNFFQLSYLIFEDYMDPLYEFRLICDKYNFDYNIKNLDIKCLIDNRKNNDLNLLIENRSNIKIKSIIKI